MHLTDWHFLMAIPGGFARTQTLRRPLSDAELADFLAETGQPYYRGRSANHSGHGDFYPKY
jgi:hypothetical protein